MTGVPAGHARTKVAAPIEAGAMSSLKTATTLLLIATPVTIGVVAKGTVELTVGGKFTVAEAPGAAVPPTPNTGSCPPQPTASTQKNAEASQVEQRE